MLSRVLENPKNETLQLHHSHGLLHVIEETDSCCIVLLVETTMASRAGRATAIPTIATILEMELER